MQTSYKHRVEKSQPNGERIVFNGWSFHIKDDFTSASPSDLALVGSVVRSSRLHAASLGYYHVVNIAYTNLPYFPHVFLFVCCFIALLQWCKPPPVQPWEIRIIGVSVSFLTSKGLPLHFSISYDVCCGFHEVFFKNSFTGQRKSCIQATLKSIGEYTRQAGAERCRELLYRQRILCDEILSSRIGGC